MSKQKMKGRAPFPIDMLRYDSCCPLHEEDSQKIIHSQMIEFSGDVFVIEVVKPRVGKFTLERWKSFGWFPVEEK